MKLRHTSPLFLSLLALSLTLSLFFIAPAKGLPAYYNWVLNPSFEGEENLIGNAGFESGQYYVNYEFEHGNWSDAGGTGQIELTTAHSGVYSWEAYYSGSGKDPCYNFSEPLLGADVIGFTFWAYGLSGGDYNILVTYTDATTSTSGDTDIGSNTWVECDELSIINTAKYVDYITFRRVGVYSCFFDDIYFAVDDPDAQTDKSMTSTPWFGADNYGFSYIQDGYIAHEGTGSYYIGWTGYSDAVCQNFEYIDSDTVQFIDLWAYTENDPPNIGVKVNVIYSDRTSTTKTLNITTASTWTHLNYGKSFISDNKYIIQIQVVLPNYIADYVVIDDVGLWSSLPPTYHRFTFSLSPTANSQTSGSFNAYQGIAYTFYGYLWDENQTLSESGTFTVATDYGTGSGTITSGQFTFSLQARASVSTLTETLVIRMVASGEVLETQIVVTWEYVAGADDTDGTDTAPMINFFVIFIMIFAPAMGFALELGRKGLNPVIGFIGVLFLMCFLGYISGLVPVSYIFACLIVTALFMLALLKGGVIGGSKPQ